MLIKLLINFIIINFIIYSSHALWLRNFVSGLGVVDSIAKPLRIYCDNTATVFFSKNGKFSSGSKHMDLKYLVVKERVQKQ